MLPWLVSQTILLSYFWKRRVNDQTWDDIFGQGADTIFPTFAVSWFAVGGLSMSRLEVVKKKKKEEEDDLSEV